MENNIPGWMSARDLEILGILAAMVPANGHILEIGSFLGRSTSQLFNSKDKSVSLTVVDTFDMSMFKLKDVLNNPFNGDPAMLDTACRVSTKEGSWRAGFEYCIGSEIYNQITVNIVDSKDFILDKTYDMIFIDGDHSYIGFKNDFEKFQRARNTLLAGDDFSKKWFGISKTLSEQPVGIRRTLIVPERSKIWIAVPIVEKNYWREKLKHF